MLTPLVTVSQLYHCLKQTCKRTKEPPEYSFGESAPGPGRHIHFKYTSENGPVFRHCHFWLLKCCDKLANWPTYTKQNDKCLHPAQSGYRISFLCLYGHTETQFSFLKWNQIEQKRVQKLLPLSWNRGLVAWLCLVLSTKRCILTGIMPVWLLWRWESIQLPSW